MFLLIKLLHGYTISMFHLYESMIPKTLTYLNPSYYLMRKTKLLFHIWKTNSTFLIINLFGIVEVHSNYQNQQICKKVKEHLSYKNSLQKGQKNLIHNCLLNKNINSTFAAQFSGLIPDGK